MTLQNMYVLLGTEGKIMREYLIVSILLNIYDVLGVMLVAVDMRISSLKSLQVEKKSSHKMGIIFDLKMGIIFDLKSIY